MKSVARKEIKSQRNKETKEQRNLLQTILLRIRLWDHVERALTNGGVALSSV